MGSMFDNIKNYIQENFVDQWRDTRMWGFIVFGIVVLLASWSGVRVIETNYELQKKIAQLEQQNQVLALQNQNQTLKNQYFETDTFLELAARQQFSKAAPGEKMVIVPEHVALNNAREVSLVVKDEIAQREAAATEPSYLRNLRAWRDFVFHHRLHE